MRCWVRRRCRDLRPPRALVEDMTCMLAAAAGRRLAQVRSDGPAVACVCAVALPRLAAALHGSSERDLHAGRRCEAPLGPGQVQTQRS